MKDDQQEDENKKQEDAADFQFDVPSPEPSGNQAPKGIFEEESATDLHRHKPDLPPPFPEILKEAVEKNGKKVFASWFDANGNTTNSYTFEQMWNEAGYIAYDLRINNGLLKGDRVVLSYSFGLRFFAAFLGCLRAGIVAVPIYPPNPKKLEQALAKMNLVVRDCNAKLILVDSAVNNLKRLDEKNIFSKSHTLWSSEKVSFYVHPKKMHKRTMNGGLVCFDDVSIDTHDLAFLQYTSGSTGDPKGVMITYGALTANVRHIIYVILKTFDHSNKPKENVVVFSWLPQYHDMGKFYVFINTLSTQNKGGRFGHFKIADFCLMTHFNFYDDVTGLIVGMLAPFVGGWNCNMMSPLDFLSDPLLWIDLMSRLKVNYSPAPNFAYRLVAQKFMELNKRKMVGVVNHKKNHRHTKSNLDLSSIVCLLCAAEPIQSDTKIIFESAFADYGLPSNWFGAGYAGLAENVVYATSLHEFKLSTLEPTRGQRIVAVGKRHSEDGQVIKIVCPERQIN